MRGKYLNLWTPFRMQAGAGIASFFVVLISLSMHHSVLAQTSVSNLQARNVIFGNYDPNLFIPSQRISDKDSILDQLVNQISIDSLRSYLTALETFGNRNSGSDTISPTRGIGAARRWIHKKFEAFSARNENRLLVGYLNFTQTMCSILHHKNVFAVLPGLDTSLHEVIVVEAHMDSRCENVCDTACYAPGMDDNGSGTVLVMELARVMSALSFDRTIIFTTVTGEEQGLNGGLAWAEYLSDNNIGVLACINNDVVGGVECGLHSSPPSCSPAGSMDSLNLRVFSYSQFNDSNLLSIHKQLARYTKLQQIEEVNPRMPYAVNLNLQIREDRVGRGGDHIPFADEGFASIRFTSSHEHGDGSGQSGDRQHTTTDLLGYDRSVPPDGVLDTFLVNLGYLSRNTVTNGINLAMLAISPPIPNPIYQKTGAGNLISIEFQGRDAAYAHRIGVRRNHSPDLYFDTVLTFSGNSVSIHDIYPKGDVQLHVMNLNGEIESLPQTLFREDYLLTPELKTKPVSCLKFYPNPVRNQLTLKWRCAFSSEVLIKLIDMQGRVMKEMKFEAGILDEGKDVPIHNIAPGVYRLYTIVNNDEVFVEGLVVE